MMTNQFSGCPSFVTGNDFATLYAPLIRDGRMEKFYWEPDRDDRIGIVAGIFEPDGLTSQAVTQLVDTFPNQAIDFFGALRSQIYNEQIRDFIYDVGLENVSRQVVNTTTPPTFRKPDFSLDHLLAVGHKMVREQQRVEDMGLAQEYNRALRQSQPQTPGSSVSPPNPSDFYRPYPPNGHSQPNHSSLGGAEGQTPPSAPSPPSALSHHLPNETVDQVRNLLTQGYRIGMEHADQRRFRANAWTSCTSVHTENVGEATEALQQCLLNYPGEYVRMIGIDPKNKQRVMEQIIQRP
jgi:ribulose bisphosphate carboxylase small subunit